MYLKYKQTCSEVCASVGRVRMTTLSVRAATSRFWINNTLQPSSASSKTSATRLELVRLASELADVELGNFTYSDHTDVL